MFIVPHCLNAPANFHLSHVKCACYVGKVAFTRCDFSLKMHLVGEEDQQLVIALLQKPFSRVHFVTQV
jgi:hypothetical protein